MFKIGIVHSLTAQFDIVVASLAAQALCQLGGHTPSAALLFSTFGRDQAGLLVQLLPRLPGCAIVDGSSNGEASREQGYRVGSTPSLASSNAWGSRAIRPGSTEAGWHGWSTSGICCTGASRFR